MAASWTSGYVGDVTYTSGFYRELAPSYLNYVCLMNGVEGLPQGGRKLRYCELGSGRGFGTALLAAANPDITFVGIDFNPTHITEARAFAARAGLGNITFIESSFGDAARSSDPALADFDIVSLHGVYSWVGESVRSDIHDFLRAKLLPGGIAYVSYNTYPGWASVAPLQKLLIESASRATGDSLNRLQAGMRIVKTLNEQSALFLLQNPSLKGRIESFERQDANYLAHEFLNENWEPRYVTEAFAGLGEAKLTYAGSANVCENRLVLCVPKTLIEQVQAAPDLAMREFLKDFAINKQFRRDVYVKGPVRLSQDDLLPRYRALTFALFTPPDPIPDVWRIPAGEATPKREAVDAILGRLAEGPATGGELMEASEKAGVPGSELPAILEILIHNSALVPCRGDFATVDRVASQRANNVVIDMAGNGDSHRFLAAPVLGSALPTSYVERLAFPILTRGNGIDEASVADKLLDRLTSKGRHLIRDGKPLAKDEATLGEIAGIVKVFRDKGLPRWRSLGAIE